ncbi:MAG: hypothetical protein JST62_06565 [Bacteroidetes bacterium]|nr:hypothetical protein [Bacteroidota bacterium]
MKNIYTILALVVGLTQISAQTYTPIKNKKERKDDFSISVKENEKEKIDWKFVKEYFSDKKDNDSIKFSVKIIQPKLNHLKSEKKYTVQGITKNIDDLISTLKQMLK